MHKSHKKLGHYVVAKERDRPNKAVSIVVAKERDRPNRAVSIVVAPASTCDCRRSEDSRTIRSHIQPCQITAYNNSWIPLWRKEMPFKEPRRFMQGEVLI
jgi:hypothetical protein